MENGETSLGGAVRETAEEAGATVRIHDDSLYTLFNLPSINHRYLFFRAELATPEFEAGAESLEVALFSESQIPSEIAFPVVRTTIECFLKDRPRGFFPVRMFDVQHGADRSIYPFDHVRACRLRETDSDSQRNVSTDRRAPGQVAMCTRRRNVYETALPAGERSRNFGTKTSAVTTECRGKHY